MTNQIQEEIARRRNLWDELMAKGGPEGLEPKFLRDIGIYGGAGGIWVNKELTGGLSDDGIGITVSVLHNGFSYTDDLAEYCVIYHYPETTRPESRDQGEIIATKNTKVYGVPLFVITHPYPKAKTRNLHFGWVEDWDDRSQEFLISFDDEAPSNEESVGEDQPFRLTAPPSAKQREVAARMGQQRFKFQVLQRYGPSCAVCGVSELRFLDAAHLRPKSRNGSDDPRNGLVLCPLHHRALDAGLFAIRPEDLTIVSKENGPAPEALKIDRQNLSHLTASPHPQALEWLWNAWSG